MDTFNIILQAISTVGFPIAMCILLLWYVKNQSETHKEESKMFTEALNKNTLALQKLCDKLEVADIDFIERRSKSD